MTPKITKTIVKTKKNEINKNKLQAKNKIMPRFTLSLCNTISPLLDPSGPVFWQYVINI